MVCGNRVLRSLARREQLIHFCREDKVAFGQTRDFVRVERDLYIPPSEAEIRVMSFYFSNCPDSVYEFERTLEIGEQIALLEMVLFDHPPIGELRRELL